MTETTEDKLLKKAKKGDKNDQFALARHYDIGFRLGFGFDDVDGYDADIYWYLKAAEQDHGQAHFYLGKHYQHGIGVEKDSEQALYWFRKGAELGEPRSQGFMKKLSGRKLLDESDPALKGYDYSELVQRRLILKETLKSFSHALPHDKYNQLATRNINRWKNEAMSHNVDRQIQVIKGDWGEVTLRLTKKYGTCFAVLNMANAYVPGGGYIEGMAAQEENMFRRTDCHFTINEAEYDAVNDQYTPAMTELLSAKYEVVYLDKEHPRVCIRGSENRQANDLGYKWLAEEDIFPFYEMRASAQDLRGGLEFCAAETRHRIIAQLDTLRITGIRHAVLGAFGCGAFENPPDKVAKIYKEEIDKRADDFDLIAFAIFSSGSGRDNYTPFMKVFEKT